MVSRRRTPEEEEAVLDVAARGMLAAINAKRGIPPEPVPAASGGGFTAEEQADLDRRKVEHDEAMRAREAAAINETGRAV